MTKKDPNAEALGRKGGQVKSKAKSTAARQNGKKGGRPKNAAKESKLIEPRAVLARGQS